MTQPRVSILAALALLVACGAEDGSVNPPSPVHEQVAEQGLEHLDRTQASYATTVFHTADGLRLPKGSAWLSIHESPEGPSFSLKLSAVASSTERLVAHFDLHSLDLTSGKVRFERGVAPGFRGNVQRHQSGATDASEEADLTLDLKAAAGQRTMLLGDIATSKSATSASFRTEVLVSCYVRPEAVGKSGNGSPGPEGGAGHELVEDVRFESDFCRPYGYLR